MLSSVPTWLLAWLLGAIAIWQIQSKTSIAPNVGHMVANGTAPIFLAGETLGDLQNQGTLLI